MKLGDALFLFGSFVGLLVFMACIQASREDMHLVASLIALGCVGFLVYFGWCMTEGNKHQVEQQEQSIQRLNESLEDSIKRKKLLEFDVKEMHDEYLAASSEEARPQDTRIRPEEERQSPGS